MDVYPFLVLPIPTLHQLKVDEAANPRVFLSSLLTGLCSPCSSCPAGTCDGCTFYFLWESAEACPLCTEQDYHEIEGACKKGFQVQDPCLEVRRAPLGITWTPVEIWCSNCNVSGLEDLSPGSELAWMQAEGGAVLRLRNVCVNGSVVPVRELACAEQLCKGGRSQCIHTCRTVISEGWSAQRTSVLL